MIFSPEAFDGLNDALLHEGRKENSDLEGKNARLVFDVKFLEQITHEKEVMQDLINRHFSNLRAHYQRECELDIMKVDDFLRVAEKSKTFDLEYQQKITHDADSTKNAILTQSTKFKTYIEEQWENCIILLNKFTESVQNPLNASLDELLRNKEEIKKKKVDIIAKQDNNICNHWSSNLYLKSFIVVMLILSAFGGFFIGSLICPDSCEDKINLSNFSKCNKFSRDDMAENLKETLDRIISVNDQHSEIQKKKLKLKQTI